MKRNAQFIYGLILFGILCFTSYSRATAQTFYKTYGTGATNESGTAIVVAADGSIFIGGEENNSCFISKLDSNGTSIWTKYFAIDSLNINQLNNLYITSDNYLIGTADIICPGQKFCGTGYFKIDFNGNVSWAKKIVAANNHYTLRKIFEQNSSTYIVVGMQYLQTGPTYSDWKFLKIDAQSGDIKLQTGLIDENHDGLSNYLDDIFSTTELKNNHFYFTGRIYAGGPGAESMRPYVVKMDTSFNVVWSNFYFKESTDYARIYPYDIVEYDDTIVCAYTGDKDWIGPDFTCGLIKLNGNGSVIWQKDYDIPNSAHDHTASVHVTPDGYLIYGATNLLTGGPHDFFFIKTDRNGNVVWSKLVGGTVSNERIKNEAYGSGMLKGNYLYFIGESDENTGRIALGRMDLNGNINCVNQSTISVSTTIIPNYFLANNNRTVTPDTISIANVTINPGLLNAYCGTIDIGRDTSFCSNFTYVIQAPIISNAQYYWSNGDTSNTITVQDSGTYSVNISSSCCNFKDTIRIERQVSQAYSQILILCSGDSLKVGDHYYLNSGIYLDTLQTSYVCDSLVTTNLNFYPTHFSLTKILCPGDSLLFNGVYLHSSGIYNDTLSSFLGCDSIILLNLQYISSPISNFTIGNDTSYCSSFVMTLTAPFVMGGSYLWNTGDTSNQITVQDTGKYIVTASIDCFDYRDTLSISKRAPLVKFQTSVVCSGDSIFVGTHFYYTPGQYSDTLLSSSGCDSIVHTTLSYFQTTYTSSITLCDGDSILFNGAYLKSSGIYEALLQSSVGCDSVLNLSLTVLPSPEVALFGDSIVCQGESTILYAFGAQNYSWKPSKGLSTTIGNQVTALPFESITYTIVGAIGTCIDSTKIKIQVENNPDTRFSYYLDPCELRLNLSTVNSSNTNCLWNFGDGSLSNVCNTSHLYASEGNYTVVLNQENSNSCKSDTSLTILVSELNTNNNLLIPTYCTPNGDGINDVFYFGNYPDCSFIHYEIFNILGQTVYQSDDVAKGWSGTNGNGAFCVIGTYFYRLQSERKYYSGRLALIR